MADLKTNYVDDKLNASANQLRKYQQIKNDDGTVSFVDMTDYTATGTSFGASDINDTNTAVNKNTADISSLNLKLDGNYYSKNEQDSRFQPKSTQTTARSAGKWVRTYNGNGYYETDYISDSIPFATNVSYGTDYFCDVNCNVPSNVRINHISNIQVTLLSGDSIAYASISGYDPNVVRIRICSKFNETKNYIIMLKIWGS